MSLIKINILMEDFCKIINVTNSIIQYTSIVPVSIQCSNLNKTSLCELLPIKFAQLKMKDPRYADVVGVLFRSLNNNLECSKNDDIENGRLRTTHEIKFIDILVLFIIGIFIKMVIMKIFKRQEVIKKKL